MSWKGFIRIIKANFNYCKSVFEQLQAKKKLLDKKNLQVMESFKTIFNSLQMFHKANQLWTDDKIWRGKNTEEALLKSSLRVG